MESEILKELKFDAEKGGFFYKGVRYLLIRPETLATFQKAVERETGERASNLLYESGFTGGNLSAKRYRELFGFTDEETVRFMMEMGTQLGWGRFELKVLDRDRRVLVVHVYHSPFAESYGPSVKPVCHIIRGVVGGVSSLIFDKKIEPKEVSCLAKGENFCKFEATW